MTAAPDDNPQLSGASAGVHAAAYESGMRKLRYIFQVAWIGGFGILACLSMVIVPAAPVVPELDWSWAGALPYFAHRGLDFGTQVVFTYGPLGQFAGFAYTGYFSTARVLWEIVIKAIGAALCCWTLVQLRPVFKIAFAIGVILFVGNFEESYFIIFLLAGCLLLRSAPRNAVFQSLFGVLFALLSLVKFTYFLQAICTIGPVTGYYLVRRHWSALISLGVSFAAGLLACWYSTGQTIEHFPAYIRHSLAITEGYGAAMSLPTSSVLAVWLAIISGILLTTQLTIFVFRNDRVPAVFGALFVILMFFLLWKHAFTRWDHAPRFFFLFPELILASWLLNRRNRRGDRLSCTVTSLAVLSAMLGATVVQPGALSESINQSTARMREAYRIITGYKQFELERQMRLREAKSKFDLPNIKAIVGSRTVDILGYGQGIALLNDLEYAPRPVFQSYSAYAPSLLLLNAAHYQSDKRPEFVISKLQTIDGRFPTLDDGAVLLQLLYRYQPVTSENGWQLWKAMDISEPVTPRPVSRLEVELNQEVAIPGREPIWLELELKQTRRGKLRSFFYKTPPVTIEVVDDTGQVSRYRLIPAMAAAGFLLNPKVNDDDQLLRAARGSELSNYRSFKIVPGGHDFQKRIKVRFSSLPLLGNL